MFSVHINLMKIVTLVLISITLIQPNISFGVSDPINLPLAYYPEDIAIDSMTNTAYISNSNNVAVINGTTYTTFNIPVGSYLGGIAVNSQTETIYATETISKTVYVIDGHANKVTHEIPLPLPPTEIAVNSNTNMVYVVVLNGTKGGLYVINGTTNKISNSILGLGNSIDIAINPNSDRVYISNFSTGHGVPQTVSVVDGNTNKVIDTIVLGHANCLTCTMPTSSGDMPIVVNPLTNIIYAGNFNNGKISLINGTNNEIIGNITLSEKSLAVDYKKNMIYAAGGPISNDGESHYVSIIDGSNNTIINKILSGGVIHRVAVNPVTGVVYMVNSGPVPSVTITDNNLTNLQTTPEFPFAIPVLLASIASLIIFYRIKLR